LILLNNFITYGKPAAHINILHKQGGPFMKTFFRIFFLFVLISGLAVAQNLIDADESDETRLEQELALASEQSPLGYTPPVKLSFRGVTHPLFIGVDDVTISTYAGDPVTMNWDAQFTGYQVWGTAYDNINDIIYFNSGSTLYKWSLVDSLITQLGTIVDTLGATQSMVSLAWYNGVLYSTKNIANEAVWSINTSTLVAEVVIDYVDADFDFGGLAVDPTNGEFYGTSDDTSPLGTGLYRIEPGGTGTLIAAYPSGETDLDGLAISNTRVAYIINDQPGNIYVCDLVSGTYGTPIPNPWTTSEIFSGGAWNMGVVPVELTSFTASVGGSNVTLLWTTATELNNSGFSIERKTGGSEYSEAAFVPGFGTTTELKSYSFTDEKLSPGTYTYRLKQIDFNGAFEYSGEVEAEVIAPEEFALDQNYPNPFNPSTTIKFTISSALGGGFTILKVYDVLGNEIAILVNEEKPAGKYEVEFSAIGGSASGGNAANLSSGVYFYQLRVGGFVQTKKMILTK
jgi:hypothetical protein